MSRLPWDECRKMYHDDENLTCTGLWRGGPRPTPESCVRVGGGPRRCPATYCRYVMNSQTHLLVSYLLSTKKNEPNKSVTFKRVRQGLQSELFLTRSVLGHRPHPALQDRTVDRVGERHVGVRSVNWKSWSPNSRHITPSIRRETSGRPRRHTGSTL